MYATSNSLYPQKYLSVSKESISKNYCSNPLKPTTIKTSTRTILQNKLDDAKFFVNENFSTDYLKVCNYNYTAHVTTETKQSHQ